MSRLDKLGEILDSVGEPEKPEEQKKWSNTYETLNEEDTIHGCFVYKNEEHVLKVSYKIYGPPNGMNQRIHNLLFAAIFEGKIEAILSRRENPDMLEAIVEARFGAPSDENFEKKKLFPYISLFEELYQQECDEAFKPYWETIQTGIKKIIDTVKDQHAGRNDPCPCGSGKKFKKCCGSKIDFKVDFSGSMPNPPSPPTPPSPPVPPTAGPAAKPKKSAWESIKKYLAGGALLGSGLLGGMGADAHAGKDLFVSNKDPKYQKLEKDEQTTEGDDI